jgi:hypothetical protein
MASDLIQFFVKKQENFTMTEYIRRYGITTVYSTQCTHSTAVEELYFRGYTVLEEALSLAQISDLKSSLDTIYAHQSAQFGGGKNSRRSTMNTLQERLFLKILHSQNWLCILCSKKLRVAYWVSISFC